MNISRGLPMVPLRQKFSPLFPLLFSSGIFARKAGVFVSPAHQTHKYSRKTHKGQNVALFTYTQLIPITVYAYLLLVGFPPFGKYSMILVLFAGTFILLCESRNNFYNNQLTIPVCFFASSILLSVICSTDILWSMRFVVPFIPGLMLFFVLSNSFDCRQIYTLFVVLSLVALSFSLTILLSFYEHQNLTTYSLVKITNLNLLVVPNDSIFFAIVAPFSLAILFHSPSTLKVKICALLSLFASLFAIVILESRGALLTFILTATSTIMLIKNRLAWVYITSFIGLVLLIDAYFGSNLLLKFGGIWTNRIPLWWAAINLFLESPVTGGGIHAFALFDNYESIPLPSWVEFDSRYTPWAHNLYLEVLANQGIIGFSTLTYLLWGAVILIRRLVNISRGQQRFLVAGTTSSFIGLSFAAWFELSFIRVWVVTMFFIVLGILTAISHGISLKSNILKQV